MVQCVLPSRPSQEAGGLPPAESSRAMSSGEEESGGAERYRAGVSHPASQGPGHRCTQPEVHTLNMHTNRHTLISTCTARGLPPRLAGAWTPRTVAHTMATG